MLTQADLASAFEICKAQAAVDGAFSEALLKHWFQASWDQCAEMVGLIWPPQDITERITIRRDGSFRLSYQPSSEVKIYDGATLLLTLPPSLERSPCDPFLCECCTCCGLTAHYRTGGEFCEVPPRFVQAVARLFTYMVENRGDTPQDEHLLYKCGAWAFLSPELTFVM